jgi:7-carboxy-7-deazaguanine synthase (Cx14CxxC type)
MSYNVKEIYRTIQGEGAHAGRTAVFCRFAGCNLWTGREKDRSSAICRFCDTDFVGTDGPGGGRFQTAESLADAIVHCWESEPDHAAPYVVCTGGEPLLQLDTPLVDAFHERRFLVAIETNGTRIPPPGIDCVCVSPKAGSKMILFNGDELKLVYPQAGIAPDDFLDFEFSRFSLQPMDGPNIEKNTELAADYCRKHPEWRLSLQMHKLMGIQ